MGDHKRLSERKTSKIRGYKKARREIALRMRQAKIAKAAERNINEGNEGEVEQPGEPGVVQGPGLVQVQVVADIHMPPAQLQPAPAAQPPDSPAQPPDSPVHEPIPLLTSTPRRSSRKGAANKPPRSPKKNR